MDQGMGETVDNRNSEKRTMSSFKRTMAKTRNDAHFRSKVLQSVWIALSHFTLGAIGSQSGPTFLDLQLITGTDVEKASAFFTAFSCGFVTGAILCGLISKKVNNSLVIFLSMVSLGAVTIATPHCSIYWLMIAIKYIGGIFVGLISTTGNSQHMKIWGNEGRVLLQLIHFCFGFGAVLSPLVTEPFLAARPTTEHRNTSILCLDNYNHTNGSDCIFNVDEKKFRWPDRSISEGQNVSYVDKNGTVMNMTTAAVDNTLETTNVHYAFLITGIIACITSLPFLVQFIRSKSNNREGRSPENTAFDSRKLPIELHLFLLMCLCAFYACYICIEDTFGAFLMTFLVREYPFVSKSKGAYITAVYWGCFAASRFANIFVSSLLSSTQLLILSGCLMIIAFTCFTISATFAAIVPLTVFAGMAGLSTASVFPAGISWSESELLHFTGRVSSSVFVSSSVGSIVNPIVVAFMIEEVSNMWFCYLILIELGVVSSIFLFLSLFNRCYVNVRYGPLYAEKTKRSKSKGALDVTEPFIENGREMADIPNNLVGETEESRRDQL